LHLDFGVDLSSYWGFHCVIHCHAAISISLAVDPIQTLNSHDCIKAARPPRRRKAPLVRASPGNRDGAEVPSVDFGRLAWDRCHHGR
jgi:hypothetical protein